MASLASWYGQEPSRYPKVCTDGRQRDCRVVWVRAGNYCKQQPQRLKVTEAGFQVTVLSSHLSVPLLTPSLLIFSPLKEDSDFSSELASWII